MPWAEADAYPYHQRPDDPNYFFTCAALLEMSFTNPKQAVAHFQATLASKRYRQEAGERYGYALALLHAHQIDVARQEAQRLLAHAPTSIPLILLNARVDAADHKTSQAFNALTKALDLFPGDASLASYYAQLSLAQGKPAQAAAPLDQALVNHTNEPNLYELRAQVASAAGQRADSYLFLADASVLKGELETAVQQLGAALRTEHFNDYDELKLRSRLAKLDSELKAENNANGKSGSDDKDDKRN